MKFSKTFELERPSHHYHWNLVGDTSQWLCRAWFDEHFDIPDEVYRIWLIICDRPAKQRHEVVLSRRVQPYHGDHDIKITSDKGREYVNYLIFRPWMSDILGKKLYVGVEYAVK